ncbi:DUF4397 domain-containing protein [Bacillus sp. FJAT-27445]|uniref:DUF4397 domain-containing protein n=1 Tax=Bacillus sp. FJAT-27445 TaxID=1679166 RepID=UPI00074345AE|nr:DUF4397 domain-containing protein [Bacillus sp. FJAT-27445]
MPDKSNAVWNFIKQEPMGRGIGRVFHANPSLGAIDILINGLRLVKSLSFKDRSLSVALPPGWCQIDVFFNGTWIGTSELNVEQDHEYFIAVTGNSAEVDIFICRSDTPIPHGEAVARFVHLAPKLGKADLSVHKGDVVFPGLQYLNVTEPLALTPFTVDLEARADGTKDILLAMPNVHFERDTAYLVCIVGNGQSLEAVFLKEK